MADERRTSRGMRLRRREFIGAVGGSALATSMDAHAQDGPRPDSELIVRRRAASPADFEVLFRGEVWVVEQRAFGASVRLETDAARNGAKRLLVDHAEWRQGASYALAFEFTPRPDGWMIGLRSTGWPVGGVTRWPAVDLVEWMTGRATMRLRLARLTAARLLESLVGDGVRVTTPVVLGFDQNLTWQVQALGGAFATSDVLPNLAFPVVRFGRDRANCGTDAGHCAIVASAEAAADPRRKLWRIGDADGARVFWRAPAAAALAWTVPESRHEPAVLRIASLGLAIVDVLSRDATEGPIGSDSSQLSVMVVNRVVDATLLHALTAKPSRLRSALAWIELAGEPPDDGHKGSNRAPEQLVVEARGGAIHAFGGIVRVTGVSTMLVGADFSRLHFGRGGTLASLRLGNVPAPDKTAGLPAEGRLVLGDRPSLVLSLDQARLQAARADDLLRLDFRFRGLALDLSSAFPTIVRASPAGTGPQAAACLVVELPPQHVAERAYFRTLDDLGEDRVSEVLLPNVALDPDLAINEALALVASQNGKKKPDPVAAFDPDRQDHWLALELLKENIDVSYSRFRAEFLKKPALTALGWELGRHQREYVGGRGPNPDSVKPGLLDAYNSTARDLVRAVQQLLDESNDTEALDEVAGARLSGPSRVVFRIGQSASPGETIFDFSLADLTDWSTLDMSVTRRAEEVTTQELLGDPAWAGVITKSTSDLESQLRYQLGDKQAGERALDTGDARMTQVTSSLRAPHAFETSIELPFRLYLSPGQLARWKVSRLPPAQHRGAGVQLWHMTLDETADRSTVRAVWSDDFIVDAFNPAIRGDPPDRGAYAPWLHRSKDAAVASRQFRMSIDSRDRHEAVGLSSVHGMPVLARPQQNGTLDLSQFEAPKRFKLSDLAGKDDIQAIYIARPLAVQELSMTALGGCFNADTTFEPPASPTLAKSAALFAAFTMERWRHRAVLGRDIEVELVYKGFLFPIGIRCSLVKLTERRFMANPVGGHPTAYLIQRMFLRIGRPDKTFPALGQPDLGRAWPAERLRMLTRRTPDILDPTTPSQIPDDQSLANAANVDITGRLRVLPRTKEKGLLFWPRTGDHSNVRFEVQIDNSAGAVPFPLIFVDNTAAKDQATLRALVRYYNALGQSPAGQSITEAAKEEPLRTIVHGGVRRRYAPEDLAGQNTHTTDRWVLNAEGRVSAPASVGTPAVNDSFEMDAVLEGADQPPFYPRLERAYIALSPVQRFSGADVVPVPATFDPVYIAAGFAESANPRHLYMRLADGVPMCFSGDSGGRQFGANGHRAGGVAQPEVSINALTRDHGPVGGMASPGQAATPGNFSPAQFFTSNAKILGFIDLGQVLAAVDFNAAAPVLAEKVDYALATSGLHDLVCNDVLVGMKGAVDRLVNQVFENSNSSGNATDKGKLGVLQQLYPDVGQAATSCRKAIDDAMAACTREDEALVMGLSGVYETGRRLVAALDRASRDPLAPIRDEMRKALRQYESLLSKDITELIGKAIGLDKARELVLLPRGLLLDPAFDDWRRLAFAYPLPPMGVGLDEIAGQVDGLMVQALGDVKWAGRGRPFTMVLDDALKAVRTELGKRAQDALGKTSDAAARALITQYLSRVTGKWDGPLLRDSLVKLGQLIDSTADFLDALIDELAAAPGAPDIGALLQASMQMLHSAQDALTELLQPMIEGELRGALDRWCGKGAQALQRALAAMSFEPTTRLLADCAAASLDARLQLATIGSADPLKSMIAAMTDATAKAWIADVRAKLSSVTADLTDALRKMCDLARQVIDLRASLRIDAANAAADLCRPDAVARLSLLPRMAAAREDVIGTVIDAMDKLREATAALESALAMPLPAQAVSQALRDELTRQVSVALGNAAALLLPWIEQASLLGAIAGDRLDALKSMRKALDDVAQDGRTPLEQAARNCANQLDDPSTGLDRLTHQLKEARGMFAAVAATGSAASGLAVPGGAGEPRPVLTQSIIAALMEAGHVAIAVRQLERPVLQLFVKMLTAQSGLALKLSGMAWDLVYAMLKSADALDEAVGKSWDDLKKALPKATSDSLLDRILAGLFGKSLGPDSQLAAARKALGAELGELDKALSETKPADFDELVTGLGTSLALLQQLAGSSQALLLVRGVGALVRTALSGDLGSLVDLDAPRKIIDEQIKNLVPRRITTSYDFSVPIDDFGGGLFKMSTPGGGLRLRATTVIELGDNGDVQPPKVQVRGELDPFEILLLPDYPVVTLQFAPTVFESVGGSQPHFEMRLAGVVLGPEVEFLQALESWLSPADGSGFYLDKLPGLVGIEAGYSLDLGIISFGDLSFINVSLGAGCQLRFDNRRPTFMVSLGRRDSPFLISLAPYGGGGFVALQSDGRQVTGFEVSFEFGGVGAFHYGPLQGEGRITTGIYVRNTAGDSTIDALFFCGGSAHIACFGVAASLAVRMTQQGAAGLSGTATFTYSFSVGFARLKFHVTVSRNQPKPARDKTTADAGGGPVFASTAAPLLEADGIDLASVQPVFAALGVPSAEKASMKEPEIPQYGSVLSSATVCQSVDWSVYKSYFDDALVQEV